MTNVALVVLDTLRKDAFDRYFDWIPGRRFERAYSTANWTVPAHASLFTGQYASEVGVHAKNVYLDGDQPTLAERLREQGYTTRAFSANANVTPHFDFDRGFDEFHTPDEFGRFTDERLFDWRAYDRTAESDGIRKYLTAMVECLRSDARTVPSIVMGAKALRGDGGVEYGGGRELLSGLEDVEFGDDEFLFCNLMETHEPYVAPEAYRRVEVPPLTESVGDVDMGNADPDHVRRAYDDCALYLSDVYRNVFDELRDSFDYVVTVSDHGEMLGERGAMGHEHGIYPELTHVPLVVSGEGMDGQMEQPVSLLDVHETVLALAGEESDTRGRSLFGPVEDHECLTEYLGLTRWSEDKLVENGHEELVAEYDHPIRGFASSPEYYGYETVDGFVETGTGAPRNPRQHLASLAGELSPRDVETNRRVPDEVADRLEDLGYA